MRPYHIRNPSLCLFFGSKDVKSQKGLFLGWKTITPILLEETQRFVQSFFTVHKAVEGGTRSV